jgi:hypothetical protein
VEYLELEKMVNFIPDTVKVLKIKAVIWETVKFPQYLRELTFDSMSPVFMLPKTLIELFIGKNYKFPIVLPPELETLKFHHDSMFNHLVNLPESLKSVQFGSSFNQKVMLPSKLHKIVFGYYFEQKVVLPDSLEEIVFGSNFNHAVVVPPNAKKLSLGQRFNRKIKLPESLETIHFGFNFNQEIDIPPKVFKNYTENRYSSFLSFNTDKMALSGSRLIRLSREEKHIKKCEKRGYRSSRFG